MICIIIRKTIIKNDESDEYLPHVPFFYNFIFKLLAA